MSSDALVEISLQTDDGLSPQVHLTSACLLVF